MDKRKLPTPALDAITTIVAALAEPFTLGEAVAASGMSENAARALLMNMKGRGWIESGQHTGRNGQKYWTRTRWFGVDQSRSREDQQRTALAQLCQCLSGWRVNHA